MDLRAVRGDITQVDVDVIVNAANPGLLGGGGVDGAIHRAGGPEILAECRAIAGPARPPVAPRAGGGDDGRPVAGALGGAHGRADLVGHEDRSAVLRSCYAESLRVADGLGAHSIAFPAISAGVYGWPLDDAARQAVAGVRSVPVEHVQEVRFVLFDDRALAAFEAAISG